MDKLATDRIDSLRYHAVGNAVTPQVAEWLGHRLAAVLSASQIKTLRKTTKRPKAVDAMEAAD